MRILLIEDEKPAADRLKEMLEKLKPGAEVSGPISTVRASIDWLKKHPSPDLILSDIQLADGLSFAIYRELRLPCPVIFITAHSDYALEAFNANGVAYLLKPVMPDDLQKTFDRLQSYISNSGEPLLKFMEQLRNRQDKPRRLLVRYGDTLKLIDLDSAAYFYTADRSTYVRMNDGAAHPIDENLDEVERIVDPEKYFRINRQFIIGIHSIVKMTAWSKSRVKIILKPEANSETIVSTDRASDFKIWLTGQKP